MPQQRLQFFAKIWSFTADVFEKLLPLLGVHSQRAKEKALGFVRGTL